MHLQSHARFFEAICVIGIGSVVLTLGGVAVAQSTARAKAAEAKALLGSVARAGAAAYERETYGPGGQVYHAFCRSAVPVPADFSLIKGRKYQPSGDDGKDFNTGDNLTGWKCLKFSLTSPIYHQFHYHQGGGYLVPSISPGARGFEAAARGDLDANGVNSTFAITGQLNAAGGVTLSQVYVENELE